MSLVFREIGRMSLSLLPPLLTMLLFLLMPLLLPLLLVLLPYLLILLLTVLLLLLLLLLTSLLSAADPAFLLLPPHPPMNYAQFYNSSYSKIEYDYVAPVRLTQYRLLNTDDRCNRHYYTRLECRYDRSHTCTCRSFSVQPQQPVAVYLNIRLVLKF